MCNLCKMCEILVYMYYMTYIMIVNDEFVMSKGVQNVGARNKR